MQEQPKVVNTDNAQQKLLAGVEVLYKAVSSTLGPRSRNVAIKRPFGAPAVVHDGVTVARACLPLPDDEENTGAEIAYQAAERTNDIGDGTTTATILCREIATQAYKLTQAGAKTMALREGIEMATEAVIVELEKQAKPIDVNDKKLLMVATVSAQVPDIGQMVADAYGQLGKEGILTVEESRTSESYLELKQGMQFDRGWVSPYFITQGNQHEEAEIEDAYILVTDHVLRDFDNFVRMMVRLIDGIDPQTQQPVPEGKINNFVIVCDQVEAPVLSFFLKNHLKGTMRGLIVTAPSFGEKRIEMLKDIAIVTDAEFVSQSTGMGLQSVTKAMLGRARRVTSTKDTTLIIDGKGSKKQIDVRVKELKAKSENTDLSAFDREKLMERLARLHSGVGILTIGAKTESESKERKERAIDAISAAKAALSEGIVPGGGMSLINAATAAQKASEKKLAHVNQDIRFGAQIIFDACRAPFNKLMSNSGFDPGEYFAQVGLDNPGMGIDVMDGQVVDMIDAGIIDPLKVVKAALGNASSAAIALYTSDTVITEQPNNKELK